MEAQDECDSGFLDESSSSSLQNEESMMSKSFKTSTKQSRRRTRTSAIDQRLLNQYDDLLLNNENLKQLTINKLRYDALRLVGREKESSLLKSIVDRATTKRMSGSKQVVFIAGYSGVGKSALANTVGDYVAKIEDGIFLRGKFGMDNYDEPYAAIADAFNGFFHQMKEVRLQEEEKSDGTYADLRKILITELGTELHLLANLIPSLETIAESQPTSPVQSHIDDDARHNRWNYAFRVLTRILSSYFSPMVILLEDLQWIDMSSLEIIDLLITDEQNPNPLVVVGDFRSNEVGEDHILFKTVQGLAMKQATFNFQLTNIELDSLEVDGVNEVVMAMLSIDDPEKTRGLADICYKRTLGNPFFLIEFMAFLEEEKLISFNFGLMSWIWDENIIESTTMSTANVVDLLQSRMQKLPADCQTLLQYIACLGTSFKTSIIDLIWRNHLSKNPNADADGLSSMLSALEESKYIEQTGADEYCWVHDKVQEAALSLGEANSPSFQFEIGSLLLHSLNEAELDVVLFDVVNLVNKGKVPRRPEYAELNLRAAQKARKISAFHSAAIFANNGIRLLPNDKFSSHRQLALELYTIGAEMNYIIGDIEQMEIYSETVLSQDSYSTLDKFPLYMTRASKLSVTDSNYRETIVLCVQVLKMLGCNLDFNRTLMPIFVQKKVSKTFRMVNKRNRNSYTEMGPMKDKKDQAIMYLLIRLAASSYHGNDIFMNVLATCEMVQMTLNNGLCELSGHPFCALGLAAVAVNQDFAFATQLAETGLFVESMIDSMYNETISNFLSYGVVFPWTRNLAGCRKELSKTYTLGMRSGSTEHAMWAISFAEISLPFQMGKNLNSILPKCPGYISQMKELKQHGQLKAVQLFQDTILILTGELDYDTRTPINNERLEPSAAIRDICNNFDSHLLNEYEKFLQLSLCVIFGRFEEAAARAIQSGDQFQKNAPGNPTIMVETFYRGLSMYAMARQTKKRKYKSHAHRIHKVIKGWLQSGNPNVQHYDCLLNAEKAALEKKQKAAEALYKYAIVLAARTGYIHDAALINERYAGYLREVGDEEEARYRIEEAIRFYRDWGAEAKAEKLSTAIS